MLAAAAAPMTALAQDPVDNGAVDVPRDPVTNRRISATDNDRVVLNFNNQSISEIIDFIVETSGKTVIIPGGTALSQRITIINDVPLTRNEALNQIFVAFLDSGVGVVETPEFIKINLVDQIARSDCPVIGPEESLIGRRDEGVIINKIFQLRYVNAEDVAAVLDEQIPDTWAQVEVEPNSNQIVALCSVGLGKKLERTVAELDRSKIFDVIVIQLSYASAVAISGKIMDTFGPSNSAAGSNQQNRGGNNQDVRRNFPGAPGGGGGTEGGIAPTGGALELRAVPDERNNTVTIIGEPSLIETISRHVRTHWDVQLVDPTNVLRTYQLQYRDVIVIRDLLNELSGEAVATGGGAAQRGGTRVTQGGAGEVGGAGGRLSELFHFQADPSANQLIAASKTAQSFDFLDALIAQLDQPTESEQPAYIELKHADAYQLAQEINMAYARDGTRVTMDFGQEELQGFDTSSSFAADTGQQTTAGAGAQQQPGLGAEGGFPWETAQVDPNAAPVSPLVGRVRVMPIVRQNAVLVVGAPHYKAHIASLIDKLDRPGRQVLITAVIAEVELEDGLSLGVRFSSGSLPNLATENRLSGGATISGTENDILGGLFDTSVLDVSIDINAAIEALKEETRVRILSQPRIFTHDNEQANFFDGQNIQFVTDSITDIQTGNLNQSFEFQNVGIMLSALPRITTTRDVDLEVRLELSSLVPGATANGGLIVDQRITETRVIVQDRQTIVLSGILREQESTIRRKIPFFGDLPLIGELFTSRTDDNTVSELVAFITPIVVDNPAENDQLNEPMRRRGDELRRPLKEQMKDFGDPRAIWGATAEPRVSEDEAFLETFEEDEGEDTGEIDEESIDDSQLGGDLNETDGE